ncbi:MAG: type II toxin-antitoxin system VapC family toxin [Bryobacteraceae bacterium]
MILVDTSVWINHFRKSDVGLAQLLADGSAGVHPFIVGELACGNLKNRVATLGDLARLPQTPIASETEVRHLLESSRLWGKGLGWIDLHLLAAARLSGWGFFTADRALMHAAAAIGIAAP